MIGLILDHLWQSTLFVAAAGLLTLFFRANAYGILGFPRNNYKLLSFHI